MRATILPGAIILTKAHRAAVSMYDGQGVYRGLSTASVFLIFTTKLKNVHAIIMQVSISYQGGSIATRILPVPNTPLSSLPLGSKV